MYNLNKIIIILILLSSVGFAKVNPSGVFVEAKAIKIALASLVVKEKGVSLLPVMDIDLKGSTPSSVFALAATLNVKLEVYAKAKNKTWKAAVFPNKNIVPSDVRNILLVVKENIKNIFVLKKFSQYPVEHKTPADVMIELTYANQWLDKIMPSIKPQYPFEILKRTEYMLDIIFKKYNIEAFETMVKTHSKITPNDVFINLTATYNLLRNMKLVKSAQGSSTHPYNILSASNKIKPLDIFTLSIFNLYFLYTSAIDFGIKNIDTTKELKVIDNIKPNDVFRQADIVNSKLANLIAVGGKTDVK